MHLRQPNVYYIIYIYMYITLHRELMHTSVLAVMHIHVALAASDLHIIEETWEMVSWDGFLRLQP
jgi:hypothetical protein